MMATIPGPRPMAFIGNLLNMQDEVPIRAIERQFDIYGPIIKLTLGGRERLFVGGFDLFDELCDETRFFKIPPPALTDGMQQGARGLFTAHSEKAEDWRQAHRILMPAFGPLAIEGMFDEMHDIASQMVMKWARKGPDHKILLTDDFTRLTLDTIALCAMDYRFNSFYSDSLDPYVLAMNNSLHSRNQRGQIGGMIKAMMPGYQKKLAQDQDYMRSVGAELVKHRRENPSDKKDLLNAMINGRDPKTGKGMRDELIAANMQTFLIAGHETTSGLLSFAFLHMLLNPSTYFLAQQEVDRVVGKEKITPKHLNQLPYINAVLRETLRLCPTAPAFARGVRPENTEETVTIGDGKYAIPRGQGVLCLIAKVQRDPKVYGDDAEEFKPERMMDEHFEKLPKNAWKPFGTGMRSCIGRAFAWQEALLVTALLLQNFDMSLDDPSYQMKIQQSLTIKPKDCYIRSKLRRGITATALQARMSGAGSAPQSNNESVNGAQATMPEGGNPISILYGSNTGTCQALAQRLAAEAMQKGYNATVLDMDSAVDQLTSAQPIIIITASYEGLPPDNAARFVAWLESQQAADTFFGVKYAVFGCGHADWHLTFHRIPKLVDDILAEHGATRIVERGLSDVSKRDTFTDFSKWTTEQLWAVLSMHEGPEKATASGPIVPTVELELSTQQRASHLQQRVYWANITDVKVLTAPDEPEKRHIEFQLPSGMDYSAGDYLAVLPLNPEDSIRRVINRFSLPWDGVITIKKGGSTTLPADSPISVFELFRGYVEILQPATRQDLEILVETTADPEEKKVLQALTDEEALNKTILDRRVSILDLLEKYPSCGLPFSAFLALLPPLRPRHYSIASSPLADPTHCVLTYSVIDQPRWSDTTKRFLGVAGNYLQTLQVGDQALVSVRSTNKFFRLPSDPSTTPVLMFCAGAGLAPFRGFVQERAVLAREGGRKLAPALLFIGCRSPTADRLYASELDAWAREGVVDVRYAFSREPEHALAKGCAHVGDRLGRDWEDVRGLFVAGAKFFTCGSGEFAKELGDVAVRMVMKSKREAGNVDVTQEDVQRWFEERRNDRFVADVFS